ncbi:trehalose-phosphatase [Novosphingobium sp. 9]|uniref:trehalose-phosphatase n=1 Tax=Novosphingobium sp. 9 TaxID=2025349 RepID=UPI0021B697D9|nr:trehalose-phosphatase [Novosphingobium sp. 9]
MTHPSETFSRAGSDAAVADLPPPPPLTVSSETALFLDFDGTLVEIADHPDLVRVPEDLGARIEALSRRLEGRLAIITGRSIQALEALLGPLDVAIAGSHGGEFRETGTSAVVPLAEPLPARAVEGLRAFSEANGGLIVEAKPFGVAVHTRTHPHLLDQLIELTESLAAELGIKTKRGKQVVELVMPGSDKGSAVDKFMSLPLFAGTKPLFLGDDVTDEDAFKVMERHGGAGVLIGPPRATAAHWRLNSVAAVHDWLRGADQA